MVAVVPEVKDREPAAGADVLARWVREGEEPGVAPAGLERVRALLNTDDRFHGEDRLAGAPEELVAAAGRAAGAPRRRGGRGGLRGRGPVPARRRSLPRGSPAGAGPGRPARSRRRRREVLATVHAASADGVLGAAQAVREPRLPVGVLRHLPQQVRALVRDGGVRRRHEGPGLPGAPPHGLSRSPRAGLTRGGSTASGVTGPVELGLRLGEDPDRVGAGRGRRRGGRDRPGRRRPGTGPRRSARPDGVDAVVGGDRGPALLAVHVEAQRRGRPRGR